MTQLPNNNNIQIDKPNQNTQEQQVSEEVPQPESSTIQNQSDSQPLDQRKKNEVRRTQSEQPTIQKRTNKVILIKKKDGQEVIPTEKNKSIPEPPPKETQQVKIEKPKTEEKRQLSIKLKPPTFTFDSLLKEWIELDNEPFSPFTIRTKGYIILKNYVLETEKGPQPGSSRSPRGRQGQGRGKRPQFTHSPSVATLVELNKDRFVSTQLEKNIGEWDETSDVAFRININQILNRLTSKNMEQSIKEIREQISIQKDSIQMKQKDNNMTPKDRENFVAKTLVDKATKEQSFSDLYADFTSKCSDEFKEKVVDLNNSSINHLIVNPGEENDEQSSLMCNGSAKFFASLASVNLVENEQLFDAINALLNELKNLNYLRPPHSHHIEMMNSFYLNISPEIARKLDDEMFDNNEIWKTIEDVMNFQSLKKRLYFLLLDVIEKRDKLRQNQDDSQNANKVVDNKFSKENMSKVRGAFSSYLESFSLPDMDIKSRDFFNASLEIFPDETKYYHDFCQFISSELKAMHASKNDIFNILKDKVQKFKEQNIEKECPNVWANISTLINVLLLDNLITHDNAKEVHLHFPEPIWDFKNSMKWYLYDFFDFSRAIHFSDWPTELRDALTLPERLDNLNHNNFPMSRLICVALIRSLYQKFKDAEMVNFHTFSKWKPELARAAEKHHDTFKSEMEILFNDFEMTKTVDQFIDYCQKKD